MPGKKNSLEGNRDIPEQKRDHRDMAEIHEFNTHQMTAICKDHLSQMVDNQDMI